LSLEHDYIFSCADKKGTWKHGKFCLLNAITFFRVPEPPIYNI